MNQELIKLIREEVRKVLAEQSLNEDFKSGILRTLLSRGYKNDVAKAFYNMSQVQLDKVEDKHITKMNPVQAYKTLKKDNPNVIVFYMSEKGTTNTYAKDSYTQKIQPNTLLGVASGDNKFYSINYPRWSNSEMGKKGPSMSKGSSGDNLGVSKSGSGYGSTGLYNVKRVAEVADMAYLIDLSALKGAGLGSSEKTALRTTQKSGATAFMTAKQFKEDNMNRYKAILKDKAASGGNETIIKGVQAAIQVVTDALSKAVGNMTTGKYTEIVVGTDPKGREVKASDAANFLRKVLDDFDRYVRAGKDAEDATKGGYRDSYYIEQQKEYALALKQKIQKANNMDYAW